jgi:hypothetical protein
LPLGLDTAIKGLEGEAVVYSYGNVEGNVFKPQRFFSPFQTNRLKTESPW